MMVYTMLATTQVRASPHTARRLGLSASWQLVGMLDDRPTSSWTAADASLSSAATWLVRRANAHLFEIDNEPQKRNTETEHSVRHTPTSLLRLCVSTPSKGFLGRVGPLTCP